MEGAYDVLMVDVVGIQEGAGTAEDTREGWSTVVKLLKMETNTRKQLQLQSRGMPERELWQLP